jgi:microcystin degradation protein MlrC
METMTMSERHVLAMMRHETNTFSPIGTGIEHFVRGSASNCLMQGQEAIDALSGTNSPFAGFHALLRDRDAQIVVPCAGNAWPQGVVSADAFEHMSGLIVDAVAGGCDAVFLDLHGAMVAEGFDDAEGELLTRIRAVAPDVPVAVALDFHTNMSAALMNQATVVAGYRTYPHVDTYETGQRAGRVLLRALAGEVHPVLSWGVAPMLTHMLRQTPAQQPMKDIMDAAIAAETGGDVLVASVFGGFPLADIPHVGLGAVVVSDGVRKDADALRDRLLRQAWERREQFVFPLEPMQDSIARAAAMRHGPVLLVDHGDNCGAGGVTDVMTVLEEVMHQGLEDVAAGAFCDPASVATMKAVGAGAELTLDLGGKTDMPALGLRGEPLRVQGRVKRITDGVFTVTGPMYTGVTMNLGDCAVLDTGTVEILVSSRPFEPMDTGVFTHAGIDPARKRFVLIKSRQHFRAGFEPIAREIVLVAGPGVCSSDYALFPFRKLRRPIYPLDRDTPYSMVGN